MAWVWDTIVTYRLTTEAVDGYLKRKFGDGDFQIHVISPSLQPLTLADSKRLADLQRLFQLLHPETFELCKFPRL